MDLVNDPEDYRALLDALATPGGDRSLPAGFAFDRVRPRAAAGRLS